MGSRAGLALHTLHSARDLLTANIESVTLEEALATAGGYRSILGILKHIAGWSHVYRSYAFDDTPRHWEEIDWPRGLRDTIEPSRDYLDDVRAWLGRSFDDWSRCLEPLPDDELDASRPLHWGAKAPLRDIVVRVAEHWTYHAGEINAILAVVRAEAWEEGEEVEENHVDTAGHRVRPPWLDSP